MSDKRKGAGGKLNRSEIVQTRLSPKLRLAAEIMARIERRTVSSLIEGLIEEAAKKQKVPVVKSAKDHLKHFIFREKKYRKVTLAEAVEHIWSPDEPDQFVAFAMSFPHLLSPQEFKMWEFICLTPYFWEHFEYNIESADGKYVEKECWPITDFQGLIREHIKQFWPLISDVFEGRQPVENLAKVPPGRPGRIVPKPDNYPTLKKVIPDHGF